MTRGIFLLEPRWGWFEQLFEMLRKLICALFFFLHIYGLGFKIHKGKKNFSLKSESNGQRNNPVRFAIAVHLGGVTMWEIFKISPAVYISLDDQ